MNTIVKACFIVSGVLLIVDSIFMIIGMENPLGLPLPCPITLIILAIGLIVFASTFKK